MKFLKIISVVFIFFSLEAEVSLIRDAEIEDTLTEIVKPIFKCAGLKPDSARIFLINSDELNAFTIGNGYIFIYTGLLRKIDNPLYLIAILSHEVGHLAAGHINRKIKILTQTSTSIIPILFGFLGAAVSGSPEVLALLLGYQMTNQLLYLRFSRDEENAADKLAVQYIEKMGYSTDILKKAFEIFNRQDKLNGTSNIPVYLMSHPKISERISYIKSTKNAKILSADDCLQKKYLRIVLKLNAYLGSRIGNVYDPFYNKASDELKNYFQAIKLHKLGNSKEAIEILRKILEKSKDIYYYETLAEFLYDSGNLDEAIKIYEKILKQKKLSPLIKISYANALVAKNKKLDEAIDILESAQYLDQASEDVFRTLAKAYGLTNQSGMAHFILAEEQMLEGNNKKALELIDLAILELKKTKQNLRLKRAEYLKKLILREK